MMGDRRWMTAWTFTPVRLCHSCRSRSRIFWMDALLGLMNSLAPAFAVAVAYRRTLKPKKSKPSVRWTIRVFSSERVRPRGANQALSSVIVCSASACVVQKTTYQSETALAAGFPAVLAPPPLARTRRTPFDLPGSPVNLQHRAAGDDMPHTPHVPVVNDDGAFRARVDRDALRSRDVYRKLHRLTFSFAPLLPAGVARSVRLLVPPRHAGPTSTHPQFLAWAAHLRECRQGRDGVDIPGVGISVGYC